MVRTMSPRHETRPIRLCRYLDLPADDDGRLQAGLDAIFFEASNTKTFASQEARRAFRERWLGRYLSHDPQWAYVALDGDEVAGYLVGCIDDPARAQRFCDLDDFARFAPLTAIYPAHLHINIAHNHRGRGIGAALIARFAAEAAQAGAPGMHVVTSRGARNVSFYERCGFREARCGDRESDKQGAEASSLLFLARDLKRPDAER